jgi:hypothetical protein
MKVALHVVLRRAFLVPDDLAQCQRASNCFAQ